MRRNFSTLFGAAVAALICSVSLGVSASELKVGDAAPNFALPGSDGQVHRLGDYIGKKAVVLAWFPKAFTPG